VLTEENFVSDKWEDGAPLRLRMSKANTAPATVIEYLDD
jgi:hypothetical protein